MVEGAKVEDSTKKPLRLFSLGGRKGTEEEARSAAENFLREQRRFARQQGALMLEEAKVFLSEGNQRTARIDWVR